MTNLDRTQIESVATALNRIGEAMDRECIEGRHIDLAATRRHIQQLRVSAQLLGLIAEGEPCSHK